MRFRFVVTCVLTFVAATLTTVPVTSALQNDGLADASTGNSLIQQQMAVMLATTPAARDFCL